MQWEVRLDYRVLLVSDDSPDTIARPLTREGYKVAWETDGIRGRHRALAEPFDAFIFDALLRGRSGLRVCRELRRRGHTSPFILLLPPNHRESRVQALRRGADDCLTKPIDSDWLLARLQALLRRLAHSETTDENAGPMHFGLVEVDVRKSVVRREGRRLDLSPKEYQLLAYLVRNPCQVFTREQLLHEVWGFDNPPATRTVDVHVSWLRHKLEANPRQPHHIITVRGEGYRFCHRPDEHLDE